MACILPAMDCCDRKIDTGITASTGSSIFRVVLPHLAAACLPGSALPCLSSCSCSHNAVLLRRPGQNPGTSLGSRTLWTRLIALISLSRRTLGLSLPSLTPSVSLSSCVCACSRTAGSLSRFSRAAFAYRWAMGSPDPVCVFTLVVFRRIKKKKKKKKKKSESD